MRRRILAVAASLLGLLTLAGPAAACGGLIGPNGAVNLLRTSTFAGYHDGVEHYVTAFQFAGGEGEFGSITPLPGIPTNVERGGDWTLQRLVLETTPVLEFAVRAQAVGAANDEAEVLLTARIDALDITVLRGGADEVGLWAKNNGFRLPPDAPEVLEFYAARSPIFMAAKFDAEAATARGQQVGDGTPIHLTIPTDNPWVPLRILALGKGASELVQADVYLLTDHRPALLPRPIFEGFNLAFDEPASGLLLADLRSDTGMAWVPQGGWLTKISIDAPAEVIRFDLAVDATGLHRPSPIDAGLQPPAPPTLPPTIDLIRLGSAIGVSLLGLFFIVALGRRSVPVAA